MFDIIEDGNAGKPRVLILSEHLNATYFISFDIPLRDLHSRGEINFAAMPQQTIQKHGRDCWRAIATEFRPDVVVFTRYAQPYGVEMMAYFKAMGIPTIYHIDDNLLELPESLGAEILKRQGATDAIEARKHLLANATLVYASTKELARVLSRQISREDIVAGEIYAPDMGDSLNIAPPRRRPIIGYMGSKGHSHDLDMVVPSICDLLDEDPTLCFETFGTIAMPERLAAYQGRVQAHSVNKSYYGFLETLKGLGWSVGLAPLVDEPFNRCKAPTKFIEYTAAGIPVVASATVYAGVIPPGAGRIVEDNTWRSAIRDSLEKNYCASTLASATAWCRVEFSKDRLAAQVASMVHTACKKEQGVSNAV